VAALIIPDRRWEVPDLFRPYHKPWATELRPEPGDPLTRNLRMAVFPWRPLVRNWGDGYSVRIVDQQVLDANGGTIVSTPYGPAMEGEQTPNKAQGYETISERPEIVAPFSFYAVMWLHTAPSTGVLLVPLMQSGNIGDILYFAFTPFTMHAKYVRNYAGVTLNGAASFSDNVTGGDLYVAVARAQSATSHSFTGLKVRTQNRITDTDTTDISGVSFIDMTRFWISYDGRIGSTLAFAIWDFDIGDAQEERLLRRPFDWLVPV